MHKPIDGWKVGEATIPVMVTVVAQIALNGYLYHQLSITGNRPPYLTARIVADGPGAKYLFAHCHELKWVVCNHLNQVSNDPDKFLWGSDGVYQNLSDYEEDQMLREELPFVLATVRAYPGQQLLRSARNFLDQLMTFDLEDLDPSSWVLDQFDQVLPRARPLYVKSRQARNAMPLELFTSLHRGIVIISTIVAALCLYLRWNKYSARLVWLGTVIFMVVTANALVSGTMSMVEGRLQCRVTWLIPLYAALILAVILQERAHTWRAGSSLG